MTAPPRNRGQLGGFEPVIHHAATPRPAEVRERESYLSKPPDEHPHPPHPHYDEPQQPSVPPFVSDGFPAADRLANLVRALRARGIEGLPAQSRDSGKDLMEVSDSPSIPPLFKGW